jgi:hypothetical protein
MLAVLTAIGYGTEDVIKRELQSSEFSMGKVFYAMYNRAASIEALPWAGVEQDNENNDGEFQQSPDLLSLGEGAPGSRFSVSVGAASPQSAPDQFSFSEGATWVPVIDEETREVAEVFTGVPGSVEELCAKLQEILRTQGYEMFHPDQLRILARNKVRGKYAILHAELVSREGITMKVMVPAGAVPDYLLNAVVREFIQELKNVE